MIKISKEVIEHHEKLKGAEWRERMAAAGLYISAKEVRKRKIKHLKQTIKGQQND